MWSTVGAFPHDTESGTSLDQAPKPEQAEVFLSGGVLAPRIDLGYPPTPCSRVGATSTTNVTVR